MINKIILFGSTGMLGNYIKTYFKNKIELVIIEYRIREDTLDNLENLLIENGINNTCCIINCIGQIPQRKSREISDKIYFVINSIFPQLLWSICKRFDAKMIQPTTDCVFTGNKVGGKYTEIDEHDETTSYGLSKSLGEPLGCTVIRTSIIGLEKYNKKSLIEWIKTNLDKNIKIEGWTNHYWNGITCLEYCKIIEIMIKKNIFWKGIRHLYSPTTINKYQLACYVADTFGYDKNLINPVKTIINIDKTLNSKYELLFIIDELENQIKELKNFNVY